MIKNAVRHRSIVSLINGIVRATRMSGSSQPVIQQRIGGVMSKNQHSIIKVVHSFVVELGEGATFNRDELYSYLGQSVLQTSATRRLRALRQRGVDVPCINRPKGIYHIKSIDDPDTYEQLWLFTEAGCNPSQQDHEQHPVIAENKEDDGNNPNVIVPRLSEDVHNATKGSREGKENGCQ